MLVVVDRHDSVLKPSLGRDHGRTKCERKTRDTFVEFSPKNVQIFGSSLKETLEPKISWLTRRLKTTRERVAGMVVRYPQLLTYSIDSNLAPTIDFFEFDMGEVKVRFVGAIFSSLEV